MHSPGLYANLRKEEEQLSSHCSLQAGSALSIGVVMLGKVLYHDLCKSLCASVR